MKAVIRWGAGLVGLLLLTSVSFGYIWVSPVTKCPLPYAPDCFGPGFWVQGPQGMWYGPCYYLMPPCGPFNGMLPGETGKALMTGGLPLTKDYKIAPIDATVAQPMQGAQPPPAPQSPWAGMMQPLQPGQLPYGGTVHPLQPGQLPYGGTLRPLQPGQLPYGGTLRPLQPPLGYGAPTYQAPQAAPTPQPTARPMTYLPYRTPYGVTYMPVSRDPAAGIWLAQGTAPNQGAFRPIPSFNAPPPAPRPQPVPAPYGYAPNGPMPMPYGYAPNAPMPMPGYAPQGVPMPMPGYGPQGAPMPAPGFGPQGAPMPGFGPQGAPMPTPMIAPMNPGTTMQTPSMPATPGMPMPYYAYGPNGFQYFLQGQDPSNKMTPLQGPQAPRMDMEPMQLPRMETAGPPLQRTGGPFPTHPFVRGPRDFFMWGTMMDEERARASRPNPVP